MRNHQNTKSKKEIYASLCQKGVSREDIENAIEDGYEEADELDAIHRIIEKKRFSPEESTDKEKKRMFDYLARKGFRSEDIRQALQVSSWNA